MRIVRSAWNRAFLAWRCIVAAAFAALTRRSQDADHRAMAALTAKLLQDQAEWRQERQEHERQVRHLNEDLEIHRKQIELMAAVILRERQRVEAESAILVRRQRAATEDTQFRDPGI